MSIMTKKFSIIVKLNNMLHMVNVGAHVDLSMLTNTTSMNRISHEI
jgi:hypothetical protein